MPINPTDPDLWLSSTPVVVRVKGTSMAPCLRDGDAVEVVRTAPDTVSRGDLLVFVRSGEITVHRLLSWRGDRFLEKGDAQSQGNWHGWPSTLGVVRRVRRNGRWEDVRSGTTARAFRKAGRRHLLVHRINRTGACMPGSLVRRVFARAAGFLARF